MAKHQIEIFCTVGDFLLLVDDVQKKVRISFVLAGLFENALLQTFKTSAELSVALASTEDAQAFLAFVEGDATSMREVPQRKGSPRYAVDQLSNPRSVVVRPGRTVDGNTLLAGQIGTASSDQHSLSLFAAFVKTVRQRFVKVKSYWLGPEALSILDSGGRLTANVAAPSDYDLKH